MARRNGKTKAKRKLKRVSTRAVSRARMKSGTNRKRRSIKSKLPTLDLRTQAAIREMNRGRSLTATAKLFRLKHKQLQTTLKKQRLIKRKGQRWIAVDNRRRKVPVTTRGRQRTVTVKGYEPARLVGQHHAAIGKFVRTNDASLLAPFEGKSVRASNGRKYPLEVDPNELHRIAAMDNRPFHEIYEITSSG